MTDLLEFIDELKALGDLTTCELYRPVESVETACVNNHYGAGITKSKDVYMNVGYKTITTCNLEQLEKLVNETPAVEMSGNVLHEPSNISLKLIKPYSMGDVIYD